jgi:hypothetical protein
VESDAGAHGDDWIEVTERFKELVRQLHRIPVPPGSVGAAPGGHGGGLQVVDGEAGGGATETPRESPTTSGPP